MSHRPLLHVGYHKTGTTWLQKLFFARRDLGFAIFDRDEIHRRLVFPHPLDFSAEECRQLYQPRLQEQIAQGIVPVVSSERLGGDPHSGGYDSKEIAERLKDVFPQARVLIVIREQRAMILSSYKQYVRAGGPCSLRDYLHPPERGRIRLPLFDFDHFAYHRLIGYYRRLFQPENVLVLPYEQFQNEAHAFLAEIARFAGASIAAAGLRELPLDVKMNESSSGVAVALRRKLNPLVVRDRLNPRVLFPLRGGKKLLDRWVGVLERPIPARVSRLLDGRLKRTIDEAVGPRYRESNRLTAGLIELDLQALGYDV